MKFRDILCDLETTSKLGFSGNQGEMSEIVKNVSSKLWKLELKCKPEFATYRGYDVVSTEMDDYSEMTMIYKKSQCEELVTELKSIQNTALNKEDEITLLILTHYLDCVINGFKYECFLMPVNYYEAPDIAFLVFTQPRMTFKTVEDFSRYLTRLGKQPEQLEGVMEVLKKGVERGIVPHTSSVIPSSLDRLRDVIEADIEENGFYKPFLARPDGLPSERWQEIQRKGREFIQQVTNPSLLRFREFLEKEYVPHLRTSLSINSLPSPPDMPPRYTAALKFYCDVDLSPQEIHDLGREKVDGLLQQIQGIMGRFGFTGSLRQFADFLSEKEEYWFESEEDMMTYCQAFYQDKIKPRIKSCFKHESHIPLIFRHRKYKVTAKAVYHAPSPESGTPGTMWLSTCLYRETRKYDVPTLMLHEADPGHHLQACYALQNTGLPEFRTNKDDRRYFESPGRFPMNTAYTEGWGLYSEELGIELGFYDNVYSYFGFLASNLARSVRMVVDTGIHQLGWSREVAAAYMREHSTLDDQYIQLEIDRYIQCPGQAASYGIGQTEFHRLRKMAEGELGDLFDLREFHDVCLSNGQVPLHILHTLVRDYVQSTRRERPDADKEDTHPSTLSQSQLAQNV